MEELLRSASFLLDACKEQRSIQAPVIVCILDLGDQLLLLYVWYGWLLSSRQLQWQVLSRAVPLLAS
ncbi:hypothetical protein FHG87_002571 [Trinorchestia longiramus]|nr:hypothetical protein FHG87_002571 [Trinorchestia longiramus]